MSRPRPQGTSQPPSKRAKLSQDPPKSALEALVNGTHARKPQFSAKTNGVHSVRQDRADESRAVVAVGDGSRHGDVAMEDAGREEIVISSGEEDSEPDSSDEGEDEDEDNGTGAGAQEEADEDAPLENGVADPAHEPTFGELLRAHAPDVIDVEASYSDPHTTFNTIATAPADQRLSTSSGTSLGTVLAQALKTNDRQLLEGCFTFDDLDIVRETVQRLPSNLAAKLLQKLAERLHKRPGRAGHLMVWVQWAIIAHGAYLAGQPEVVRQLADLNRVLKQRASGLQPLLSLKGRLDMLKSQVLLRESIQNRAARADENDEPVIYVESREEESEKPAKRKGLTIENFDDTKSSEDEMPTTMNDISDAEDSEADSQDSEDLIDDEAEETDNDSGDDLSESEAELESDDDLDDAEDIEDSEEESTSMASPTVVRRN